MMCHDKSPCAPRSPFDKGGQGGFLRAVAHTSVPMSGGSIESFAYWRYLGASCADRGAPYPTNTPISSIDNPMGSHLLKMIMSSARWSYSAGLQLP